MRPRKVRGHVFPHGLAVELADEPPERPLEPDDEPPGEVELLEALGRAVGGRDGEQGLRDLHHPAQLLLLRAGLVPVRVHDRGLGAEGGRRALDPLLDDSHLEVVRDPAIRRLGDDHVGLVARAQLEVLEVWGDAVGANRDDDPNPNPNPNSGGRINDSGHFQTLDTKQERAAVAGEARPFVELPLSWLPLRAFVDGVVVSTSLMRRTAHRALALWAPALTPRPIAKCFA